jgi:hypothetical protein
MSDADASAAVNAGGDTIEPPAEIMEQFKRDVRSYMTLDSDMQRTRDQMRAMRKEHKRLTAAITNFMAEYNVEDLNTREGRLRCKTISGFAPVKTKDLQQRLIDYFRTNLPTGAVTDEMCSNARASLQDLRPRVEKTTLRRMRTLALTLTP